MINKQSIADSAVEIAEIALTIGSVSSPVMGVAALAPEYLYGIHNLIIKYLTV